MKKIILFFLVFLIVLSLNSKTIVASDSEWYPFVIPEKLDPDSPINIGKLVLDAPAGKHGFCKVKDKHFYFEDGTRAKFWGTNLCFEACFPDKKQAKMLAERIAFFGFNAVRLHHMDFYFEPKGIFEDTCPGCKNPQMKKTTKLSKKQLDKLDYFIFQLKQRGIYVDMNLLVSRHFTEADGIKDAQKLGMAAKPASMFDPELIALQKQYAKDLLTHFNPYTKLRYCDDPAVALVEIINETTLFDINFESLSDYYSSQLRARLDTWREKNTKYTDDIKTFISQLEKQYFKEMVKFLHEECSIKIPITGIGGHIKWGDIKAQEECDFIDMHEYWDHPSFPDNLWDSTNFKIHNKAIITAPGFGIAGRISDRIPPELDKPFTITEWNHCYPNTYAYETPVLLAIKASLHGCAGLFQFAYSHGWASFDNIHSYFDTSANPQQSIMSSLGSILYQLDHNQVVVEDGVLKVDTPLLQGIIGNIKNKQFKIANASITANENGAIIIYSPQKQLVTESERLIAVALSEVKNTDSGWINNKFRWGKSPVLLKKIKATILLERNKPSKVYEITTDGKRAAEIESSYVQNTLYFMTTAPTPWFEIITDNSTIK